MTQTVPDLDLWVLGFILDLNMKKISSIKISHILYQVYRIMSYFDRVSIFHTSDSVEFL